MSGYSNGYAVGRAPMILKPLREYSQFTLDPANRDIKENHLERLAEGIDSMYLLDLFPIVSSTEKVIMDGQHRFTVAKSMLVPYYAISGDDIAIEDVAEANLNTQKYDEEDALALYANLGVQSYVYLRNFLDSNLHVYAKDARQWLDESSTLHDFVEGRFAVQRPEYAQVIADRLKDFISVHAWVNRSVYKRVLANLTLNPIYDHARMMERLTVVPVRLLRCTTEAEAFPILSAIYNHNMKHPNRYELKKVAPTAMINRYDKSPTPIIEGLSTPVRGIIYQRQIEVYSTSDLERFHVHPSARPVREKRLASMIDFMKRRNLMRYYPILVDKNYTVLDGQKRLLAARELGLPVHFIVTNHFSLHMAALAAGRSQTWALSDYLKHFSELQNPEYLYLAEFTSRYPFISIKNAIRYLGPTDVSWVTADYHYRKGKFRAAERARSHRIASVLNQVQDERLKRYAIFQYAMLNQMANPEFDAEKFVERLNKHRDLLGPFADVNGCIAQMSIVYNARVLHDHHVKLERVNLWGDVAQARIERSAERGTQ